MSIELNPHCKIFEGEDNLLPPKDMSTDSPSLSQGFCCLSKVGFIRKF